MNDTLGYILTTISIALALLLATIVVIGLVIFLTGWIFYRVYLRTEKGQLRFIDLLWRTFFKTPTRPSDYINTNVSKENRT